VDEVISHFDDRGVRTLLLKGMPGFSTDWDVFIPARDRANIALIAIRPRLRFRTAVQIAPSLFRPFRAATL
jgi:hypothetical protein